jgi:hypothetical protein
VNQLNPFDSLSVIDLEFLPQQALEQALAREYAQADTVLQAHSWITPQIRWNKPPVRDVRLGNLVAFPALFRPVMHAVPANYGDAVHSEFLKLSYIRDGSEQDVFRELNKQSGVRPTPQPDVRVLVANSIQQLYDLDKAKSSEFSREFSCVFPAGIQGERARARRHLCLQRRNATLLQTRCL